MSKRKHEISKIQTKKINFINQLKYAEVKIFCICIDVYKNYEGDDYDEIYKDLSILKNKKLKINNTIRLMKWICYYDRSYYENINYYDLMASICIFLKNHI